MSDFVLFCFVLLFCLKEKILIFLSSAVYIVLIGFFGFPFFFCQYDRMRLWLKIDSYIYIINERTNFLSGFVRLVASYKLCGGYGGNMFLVQKATNLNVSLIDRIVAN